MAKNQRAIVKEIFFFSSCLLVVLIVLEVLWPDIVLAYFNLNYLWLLWLASGLAVIIKNKIA